MSTKKKQTVFIEQLVDKKIDRAIDSVQEGFSKSTVMFGIDKNMKTIKKVKSKCKAVCKKEYSDHYQMTKCQYICGIKAMQAEVKILKAAIPQCKGEKRVDKCEYKLRARLAKVIAKLKKREANLTMMDKLHNNK